jgi:hypothetical protein
LITPPEQRYRYFDRLFYGMYHLRYSMLQSIQHLVTSRHKQRRKEKNLSALVAKNIIDHKDSKAVSSKDAKAQRKKS